MKPIIVFGSINIDLVTTTPRLPMAGETLQGREFFTAAGGKGANQAVAASRLGIPTHLVGRLGNDDFGHRLLGELQGAGIGTEGIALDETTSTGVATIVVDDAGENTIITVAGANHRLDRTDVERLQGQLSGAAALLIQLEVPLPTVQLAAQAAQAARVPLILDPAPIQTLPAELYPLVDIITPNQVEASHLVGFEVSDRDTAAKAATILRQRGVGTAIVKLGARGVCCEADRERFFFPAFPVEAVDTVAAGDAFNGALAAALATGRSLRQAVTWGAAAGALAVTKAGAQPSLPHQNTFEAFLQQHDSDI
jgi:ribokinase